MDAPRERLAPRPPCPRPRPPSGSPRATTSWLVVALALEDILILAASIPSLFVRPALGSSKGAEVTCGMAAEGSSASEIAGAAPASTTPRVAFTAARCDLARSGALRDAILWHGANIALSQPPLEGSALPRPFPRSARARAVSALRAPPDRRSPVRGCAVVVQHDGPARFGCRHDAMVPHGEDGDECERAAGVPRGWAERARLERDDRSVEGASANSAPPTRFFPFRALAACILRDRTASAHRRSNPDAANASECEFMVD